MGKVPMKIQGSINGGMSKIKISDLELFCNVAYE